MVSVYREDEDRALEVSADQMAKEVVSVHVASFWASVAPIMFTNILCPEIIKQGCFNTLHDHAAAGHVTPVTLTYREV